VDAPRRRLDPLALAVNGFAIAGLVAVGAYLAFSFWHDPPLAEPTPVARPPVREISFELVDLRPQKEKRDFSCSPGTCARRKRGWSRPRPACRR